MAAKVLSTMTGIGLQSVLDHNYHKLFIGFSDPDKDRSVLKFPTGRRRLNLFKEFNMTAHEDYPPLYTMREESFRGLPSAYQIYMESESEYEAAIKLVGSWTHWKLFLECKDFFEGPSRSGIGWTGVKSWREEKEIQDAARAYQQLKVSAEMGNVQAQKEIWANLTKSKKGAPSKAEIAKAAKEAAESTASIKEDLKRLELVTANGNKV